MNYGDISTKIVTDKQAQASFRDHIGEPCFSFLFFSFLSYDYSKVLSRLLR